MRLLLIYSETEEPFDMFDKQQLKPILISVLVENEPGVLARVVGLFLAVVIISKALQYLR